MKLAHGAHPPSNSITTFWTSSSSEEIKCFQNKGIIKEALVPHRFLSLLSPLSRLLRYVDFTSNLSFRTHHCSFVCLLTGNLTWLAIFLPSPGYPPPSPSLSKFPFPDLANWKVYQSLHGFCFGMGPPSFRPFWFKKISRISDTFPYHKSSNLALFKLKESPLLPLSIQKNKYFIKEVSLNNRIIIIKTTVGGNVSLGD